MKFHWIALFASLVFLTLILPAFAGEAPTSKEKVLYSFCSQQNCSDGAQPEATLINVNGTLYGETRWGGNTNSICENTNCGVLFALDRKTGTQTFIYLFCSQQNCTDGANPTGGMISVGGILYGTTRWGGANDGGTVFSLDPSTGTVKVVYSFCSVDYPYCTDGYYPVTMLTDVNGILFGTTYKGGTNTNCPTNPGCGTLFSVDPSTGTATTLYSFCIKKNCSDGEMPWTTLLKMKGVLYGTTTAGGANCRGDGGCGTVFSFDPSTKVEKVRYSFAGNGTDGANPFAGPINVNGSLYGTTSAGGKSNNGTVFALDLKTDAEQTLHSFCSKTNCADGEVPVSNLISANGTLYGTTLGGGNSNSNCGGGTCGVVFAVDPTTGAETRVYAFCSQANCTDGANLYNGLINVNGTLYGTTGFGGSYGSGTVFSLKP